jgi:uncharacterized protein
MPPQVEWPQRGLHVIAKPAGPKCNLRCEYCFYLKKEELYPGETNWKMSDETLEAYVRQYFAAQSPLVEEIDFAFQGGEPTLMGIEFYERLLTFQQKHLPDGKRVHNSLQTNGILLDDRWCEFLKKNDFLVGLSIDGPRDLHDKYRLDHAGAGTFDSVSAALNLLQKHEVEFNALICVNRHNADHALDVYRFFRKRDVQFLQFIPIVEPIPEKGLGTFYAENEKRLLTPISDRSVTPEQLGKFLINVFEEWVWNDVGRIFVRDFDQSLSAWSGAGATLCVYAPECGRATAIEHNGDIYACDHFVDPQHLLGNIHETPISVMANSPEQEAFGRAKKDLLPQACLACPFLNACNGGCPKDRLVIQEGEPDRPLNYLCDGFKAYFEHIEPCMEFMTAELKAGRSPAGIMQRLQQQRELIRRQVASGELKIRRNDPCPCGSGKKFKVCCMER